MTKFVIVSQPRSGTHMVGGALASRADVHCPGEIFDVAMPHIPPHVFPNARGVYDAVFARGEELGKAAAGGMIHPSAMTRHAWAHDLYTALWDDPTVRVVRVWRRNLVHQYVSLKQAELSGFWRVSQGHEPPQKTIRVGHVGHMVRQMDRWQQERDHFEDVFYERTQGYLTMWYEEIAAEWDDAMEMIQEHLWLPRQKMACPYVKQRRLPMSEVVEDWKSVVDGLRGTEYQVYLEG